MHEKAVAKDSFSKVIGRVMYKFAVIVKIKAA